MQVFQSFYGNSQAKRVMIAALEQKGENTDEKSRFRIRPAQ
jgi:hypothetical protein